MPLSESDWIAVEREFCARKLVNFVRRAWPVVEPGTAYVHGWHIEAIADHLEAVSAGEINRLLINVPPGTMKSLAVGVPGRPGSGDRAASRSCAMSAPRTPRTSRCATICARVGW